MSALTSLPVEILGNIIACLPAEHATLANCCLTCHRLWEVTVPVLYRNVDLTAEANPWHEEAFAKQRVLMKLLAT